MDLSAPGDIVVGRIARENKNWAGAELVELTSPSPLRTEPSCPLYGICGGCSLQHLAYEAQIREKQAILRDALTRIGKLSLPAEPPLLPSPPYEYRNRMQLHCLRIEGGGLRIALMGRRSGEPVPLEDCPVADPGIRFALKGGILRPPPGRDRFTVYSRGDTLVSEGSIDGKRISRGKVPVLGRELLMDAGVFFQSNAFMLEKLLSEVLSAAAKGDPGLPMADIYCGVGTFASFLGERFPRMDLVEENPAAIALARENVRRKDIRFFAHTVDQWIKDGGLKTAYGFMIADPPRQGFSPLLRKMLVMKGPPVLVYISCDPATLARDCGELTDAIKGSYTLEHVIGFDFYPQTAHIESMAVLVKR
jgi:23S rRNA (uracil1939-C5)-methyltransferase